MTIRRLPAVAGAILRSVQQNKHVPFIILFHRCSAISTANQSVQGCPRRKKKMSRFVNLARLVSPLGILFPIAFFSVSLILNSLCIERHVTPLLIKCVAEAHLVYLMLFAYWVLTYFISPFLANVSIILLDNQSFDNKVSMCNVFNLRTLACKSPNWGPPRKGSTMRTTIWLRGTRYTNFYRFPGLLAALFTATMCRVDPGTRFSLVLIYLVSRCLYIVVYAFDLDIVRSFTWLTGQSALITLFLFALIPNYEKFLALELKSIPLKFYANLYTRVRGNAQPIREL